MQRELKDRPQKQNFNEVTVQGVGHIPSPQTRTAEIEHEGMTTLPTFAISQAFITIRMCFRRLAWLTDGAVIRPSKLSFCSNLFNTTDRSFVHKVTARKLH